MNRGHLEELLSSRLGERALLRTLLNLTPGDPVWAAALDVCEAHVTELGATLGTREVSERSCSGCPSWIAPLVSSSLTGGRCWLQTVPMGEGCQMARLQAEGEV